MKNQMWSGRFSTESSELLKEFNASLNFDKILYKHDIQGSIAHATMLEKCGIITQSELDSLVAGLKAVQSEIEQGKFSFDIRDEDIHMAVERRLSELVGEVGGKLHTARSRNDQVATDFKLYVKEQNLLLQDLLKELIVTIIAHAKAHQSTIMPSFTHLQHAQPVSFAFYILAYAFSFVRVIQRLRACFD